MRPLDRQPQATATGRAIAGVRKALDRAVPKCELALSAAVRRPAGVTVTSVDAVAAAEACADDRRSWFRIGGRQDRCAALALETPAVVRFADVLMGGRGEQGDGRPSTLEVRLVAGRLTVALECLGELLAAQGVAGTAVEAVDGPAELALDGQLVQAALDIALGEARGAAWLLVPLAAHAVPAGRADADGGAAVVEALAAVPVPVSVRFAPLSMRASELDGLEVGDVIRLEQPSAATVVAEVGGHPLFRGRPGRQGRRLAVEVVEMDKWTEVELP